MMMLDGDSLGDMLMHQEAGCLKCGSEIAFGSGAKFARSKGINENVVMCSKCKSVFRVHIVPGHMSLTEDVTRTYFTPEEVEKMIEVDKENTRGCIWFFVCLAISLSFFPLLTRFENWAWAICVGIGLGLFLFYYLFNKLIVKRLKR
jgi:ribosomal protein L24E